MIEKEGFEIILASSSPRRHAFFQEMGFPFVIKVIPVTEEFPLGLNGIEISQHIVRQKANPFVKKIKNNQLIITADTIVWHENKSLGKPKNSLEAEKMLTALSESSHEVITSVGFLQKEKFEILYEVSKVTFGKLSDIEIKKYIMTGSPLDKAGAYGIQDSFGMQNVISVEGCYSNIIGLPVPKVLKKIKEIISEN
tara:strand:+ start:107 stop:694 length:588 start_codon:yes stop_codon:yes gene_type:complete